MAFATKLLIEALCLRYCKENLGNFLNEYNERMTQWISLRHNGVGLLFV